MNTLNNVFNDILLLFILSESSKYSSLDCVLRPTEGECLVFGERHMHICCMELLGWSGLDLILH